MQSQAYQTPLIKPGDDYLAIIAEAIGTLEEKTVVAIASKIISTAENRLVPKKTGTREEKFELVRQEADYYTEPHSSKYGLMLTIKDSWLFMFAGIDESNIGGDNYLLWPSDPQQAANQIWAHLKAHFSIKDLGVIITDSTSQPLNWGVRGHAIAHCGFEPLFDYIGQDDLYGRPFQFEKLNIMQCLASVAVLEMGEGNESTPVATISNIPRITFVDALPSEKELQAMKIEIEDDAYAPLLENVDWKSKKHIDMNSSLKDLETHELGDLGKNSDLLFEAAEKLSLHPQKETSYGVFSILKNDSQQFFFHTKSPRNSASAAYQVKNKQLCRKVVAAAGFDELNIPYALPENRQQLHDFWLQHDRKIVAKPLTGSKSIAVFLVTTQQQIDSIDFGKFYFEAYVAGNEYRYLVLDEEVLAVQVKTFKPGTLTKLSMQTLPEGDWHDSHCSLAKKIATAVDLHWCAVDFLVSSTNEIKLLEVNANPGLLRIGLSQSHRLEIATAVVKSFLN